MRVGCRKRQPRPTKRGASEAVDTGPEWSYGLAHRSSGPGWALASQTDNRAVGWMMRSLPLGVGERRILAARADWRRERGGQTLTSRKSKRRWQVSPWCRRARHRNGATRNGGVGIKASAFRAEKFDDAESDPGANVEFLCRAKRPKVDKRKIGRGVRANGSVNLRTCHRSGRES